MREILFRGKDTLGHWLYGGFHLWETRQPCVMGDKLKPEEIKHIIIQNSFADWNMPRTMQPYMVIPETIGQYTGLTDKHGTKIFEDDIVNFKTTAYHFKNCRIKYQSCYARYCAIDNKGYEYPMDKTFEYEVIGNIHDNPELLKEREG